MRPGEFPGVGTEAFRPNEQVPELAFTGFVDAPAGRWGRVHSNHACSPWPVIDWSRTRVFTSESGDEWVRLDVGDGEPAEADPVTLTFRVGGRSGGRSRELAGVQARGWSVGYTWVDEVAYVREVMGVWPTDGDGHEEPVVEPVPDVRERALRARQTRNTGPAVRRRAPRRIDAPRSR